MKKIVMFMLVLLFVVGCATENKSESTNLAQRFNQQAQSFHQQAQAAQRAREQQWDNTNGNLFALIEQQISEAANLGKFFIEVAEETINNTANSVERVDNIEALSRWLKNRGFYIDESITNVQGKMYICW